MKTMKNVIKSVVVAVGVLMTAQVASAQQKIGHMNSMEIMQATPEFKNADTELQTFAEGKQKELQDMYGLFQQKQTEINEKAMNRSEANKATVDAEIDALVQERDGMQERMQSIQSAAEEAMQQKQEELFAPIQQKVINTINAVAKEQGFAYIFDLAAGSVYPFEGSEDITPLVKAKLGAQ